jgi:hypothetical protein
VVHREVRDHHVDGTVVVGLPEGARTERDVLQAPVGGLLAGLLEHLPADVAADHRAGLVGEAEGDGPRAGPEVEDGLRPGEGVGGVADDQFDRRLVLVALVLVVRGGGLVEPRGVLLEGFLHDRP